MFEYIIIILIILLAVLYLVRFFFKKESGCCGCSSKGKCTHIQTSPPDNKDSANPKKD